MKYYGKDSPVERIQRIVRQYAGDGEVWFSREGELVHVCPVGYFDSRKPSYLNDAICIPAQSYSVQEIQNILDNGEPTDADADTNRNVNMEATTTQYVRERQWPSISSREYDLCVAQIRYAFSWVLVIVLWILGVTYLFLPKLLAIPFPHGTLTSPSSDPFENVVPVSPEAIWYAIKVGSLLFLAAPGVIIGVMIITLAYDIMRDAKYALNRAKGLA